MIALGGAVYAALMGMNNYNKHHNFYSDHKEPLEYQTDVLFKFKILSDKGYNIKNILEEQLNKPSEFIRDFSPIYEIIIDKNENTFELKMIKSTYMLHHSQIIELLSNNGFVPGEDYILNWIFGSWNRKTKEFKI